MSSSVPAVIPAFVTLATNALPSGAQVWLGTVLPANFQSGPGDVTGVTSGVTLQITGVHFLEDMFAELGPSYRHEEHYNIECTLCAWNGGPPDFTQPMADVYAMYADLTVAVSNNPTLGLTTPKPRLAWPRQLDFSPAPDPFGRTAGTITFEVQVQARVESLT